MQHFFLIGISSVIIIIVYFMFVILKEKSLHKERLLQCLEKETDIHILTETEFGLVKDSVETVKRMILNSSCPNRLYIHIYEPVLSVKEQDFFRQELDTAMYLNNKDYYFRDRIQIHKTHKSRKIEGPSKIILYLIERLSKTIQDTDTIVWIPPNSLLQKDWDINIRKDLLEIQKNSSAIVTWPFDVIKESYDDIEYYFTTKQSKSCFFVFSQEKLEFDVRPIIREGNTTSVGLSFQHPIASTSKNFKTLCSSVSSDYDFILTFFTYYNKYVVVNGLKSLGYTKVYNTMHPSLQQQKRQLITNELLLVSEKYKEQFLEWISNNALQFDDELKIFGRSLLGISKNAKLSEILIKWGSEANFETEKESLLYG